MFHGTHRSPWGCWPARMLQRGTCLLWSIIHAGWQHKTTLMVLEWIMACPHHLILKHLSVPRNPNLPRGKSDAIILKNKLYFFFFSFMSFRKVEINPEIIHYLYYNNVFRPWPVILSMPCMALHFLEKDLSWFSSKPASTCEEIEQWKEGRIRVGVAEQWDVYICPNYKTTPLVADGHPPICHKIPVGWQRHRKFLRIIPRYFGWSKTQAF